MNEIQMRNELQKRLEREGRTFTYNHKDKTLRIENEHKQGVTISLQTVVAKWSERKDDAIQDVVYYVDEALGVMGQDVTLTEKEKNIFPVIRSTSFPTESNEGHSLLTEEHTAETRIYYALDLGSTYRLIDTALLHREEWSSERVKELARFNVRSLPTPFRQDQVRDNLFYFVNAKDGYDASRILNDAFLKNMSDRIEGEMTVSVPHQDTLIIGDIRNEAGYDILAQMTMHFFTTGPVPVTALSFVYDEGKLEPIFILGKNRPVDKEK
ncbi:DUF1444 domain-containing protein [Bacillus coahuilensis]|uniref:DUF1444 domain-containing protein n=1 Tax=Bacillus coahuilensis TaxID=408580 RepID=UPI0004942629|nr:DUF1444 domain-containing protein [Bacillus coahuilensis]